VGVRTEHIQSLMQRVAHSQTADEYTRRLAISQMSTAKHGQQSFRLVLAALHQVLAVDLDHKISATLKKHHFIAVRCPGGRYFLSRLHDGILLTAAGSYKQPLILGHLSSAPGFAFFRRLRKAGARPGRLFGSLSVFSVGS